MEPYLIPEYRIKVNPQPILGFLQDPQFWQGLKSAGRAFLMKCRQAGSSLSVVNIFVSILLNFVAVVSVFMPVTVNAGVFSWLFGTADAQQMDVAPISNSQNMALLQAAIDPDGIASSTTEISIIGGTSLLPETQAGSDVKNANDDQISLYVVHKGDTLPAIAKMFGVSVNTIRWGNDLTGNTITVGQTLVILPISGIQHTVKKGDTLQSIAKLHKGDLDEILQYNNLTKDSKLAVGDVIVIPDGEATAVSNGSSSSGVGKPSPAVPVYNGYYMRPIIGGIKTQGIHGHNGVDLASSYGANILASADGQVIISRNSGWNGGYGSYIVLKHNNGTQTLYGHLSATLVSVGDTVTQGQVIGKMGNSGQVTGHTGIHLHFEIRGAKNPF